MTAKTEMPELKPCPKCKDARQIDVMFGGCGWYSVKCQSCNWSCENAASKEEAVLVWNTRAASPAIEGLDYELRYLQRAENTLQDKMILTKYKAIVQAARLYAQDSQRGKVE